MKLTIAWVSGSLAGPIPAYCGVARRPDRTPLVREVPVEVDAVRVLAELRRLAVGVHRLDEPEFDAVGHGIVAQLVDDRDAVVLVAVDDPDDHHRPPAGLADALGDDRCTVHRTAEPDDGRVEIEQSRHVRNRDGRGGAGRGRRGRAASRSWSTWSVELRRRSARRGRGRRARDGRRHRSPGRWRRFAPSSESDEHAGEQQREHDAEAGRTGEPREVDAPPTLRRRRHSRLRQDTVGPVRRFLVANVDRGEGRRWSGHVDVEDLADGVGDRRRRPGRCTT